MNMLDKQNNDLAAILMAAGKETRMRNSEKAKVMFEVGGLPMIHHVVNQAMNSGANKVIVIVGHNKEDVKDYLKNVFEDKVEFAEQLQQLGTGHAVIQAIPNLENFNGDVLILSGDVPLLSSETIKLLFQEHSITNSSATILTVIAENPTGYGRVIRNQNNVVEKIVEQKDANQTELLVKEINSGIYVFKCKELKESLSKITNDNSQGEYYLTDVIGKLVEKGKKITAFLSNNFNEVQGVNTPEHLAEVEKFMSII